MGIVTQNQETVECELLIDSRQILHCQVPRDIGQTIEDNSVHRDTERTKSRV